MFKVKKGMVLIMVGVALVMDALVGCEWREHRTKRSDPMSERTVRLADVMWKKTFRWDFDPWSSISIAKKGAFPGTQRCDVLLCFLWLPALTRRWLTPRRERAQTAVAVRTPPKTSLNCLIWSSWLNSVGWMHLCQSTPFLDLKLTLSIRKILVRLRAMRVPSTRNISQSRTKCVIIATGAGYSWTITKVNELPHWKNAWLFWV